LALDADKDGIKLVVKKQGSSLWLCAFLRLSLSTYDHLVATWAGSTWNMAGITCPDDILNTWG
jgi:hypothetical protein